MKFKLLAGAALAAVFAASGASAQNVGWYGAVDLGYHWPDSIEADSSNNAINGAAYSWDISQEDDWAGFARLGYQLNDHWRVELEGGYRPGDISAIRGGGNNAILGLCTPGVVRTPAAAQCGSPSGDVEAWTLLGNVIYGQLVTANNQPMAAALSLIPLLAIVLYLLAMRRTGALENV